MISTIVSSVLFLGCLVLILSEKMHRTITAIAGAALMVFLGKILGFYSEKGALAAIDFNTLGLLFGMMILIAMLEPTGFFQYVAVQAARASKGNPVRLFVLLGAITTILSMFIDNVTTVVLIAPVTILISQIIGINAMPFLIAEALLSNTGGVATLIGDPPNVLIGSAANLSFNDFLIYSFPMVILVWLGALILLRYLFRKELSKKPKSIKAIMRLNPAESLNQPADARRILMVLGGAIFFFFIHHMLHINPAMVALGAAAIALVWVQPDVHEMFKRLEWSVLVFFAGLFVMVGGLEHAGVMNFIVRIFVQFSDINPLLFGVGMIWAVAALSAIVDNVPMTIALIPVIKGLGESGLDISPLWWALAFGAGFGGNGTIIGASANIIVAALSEKTAAPITPKIWARRGLPVMLLTCLISSVLYAIFFRWM
ncbi:MAG: SLC13 family permease [Anaerolineales bacterium]